MLALLLVFLVVGAFCDPLAYVDTAKNLACVAEDQEGLTALLEGEEDCPKGFKYSQPPMASVEVQPTARAKIG